ncbi:ribosylnicotinamide kinase [Ceratobasidium sp. 394]|nr:ribosylnicotinamide kinase [Ceratobasidium sp. 394]
MKTRVVVIGIGGGSSSGKTTLTAQLRAVIPECALLRQDMADTISKNFWTPIDKVPKHPVYNRPDLEDPPGTIDWPAFREAFKRFRSDEPFVGDQPESSDTGPSSSSLDATLPDELLDEWRSRFRRVEKERMRQGVQIEWRIVEGFVLYYEPEIITDLDVSILLRSSGHVLRKRSCGRQYFHSDGTVWVASPEHWDRISYPAYIRAHEHLFHNGDVDRGTPIESYNLTMLDGQGTERNMSFEEFFTTAASAILWAS